jgi:3-hydroxybutyryl-CoA dehydrogenase
MALDKDTIVGVIGAGAMGTGIAQVAAAAGHRVVLGDAMTDAARKAQANIAKAMDREVEKARLSRDDADAIAARIDYRWEPLTDLAAYRHCGLVIEAVREDLEVKRSLFQDLEKVVGPEAVLATNTSSLSVTSIAAGLVAPERVVGLHFFNPAPVMQLVEVVPWIGIAPTLAPEAYLLMKAWNKTPVLTTDTPGFIVNRIARPFYGESIRILEEGVADCATIDHAMRELGKFRMGPFELMDFIGNDVNYAVTRSVYDGMFQDPRYKPSLTQKRLVEAGYLGKKSGRGYYSYAAGAAKPQPKNDPKLVEGIYHRVLAMMMNEAIDAVFMQVASPKDVDLAMTKGVNYPAGLLAWVDKIGAQKVLGWMEGLRDEYGEDRYRPSPLLRRMARENRKFFE